MVKKILMLSGKAGAGKDTFAQLLGRDWERVAFADAVREEAVAQTWLPMCYFVDRDKKDTPLKELRGKSPRDVLIDIGMTRRAEDPLHWINKVTAKIEASSSEYFVVTDWRFPNEFEVIYDHFFSAADVVAPVSSVRIVGSGSLRSSHYSECALDDFWFDYSIDNSGTIQDLQNKADAMNVVAGVPEAVNKYLTENYRLLLSAVKGYVLPGQTAADFVQESAISLPRLIAKRYNFTCALNTFVYRAVRLNAMNIRRKELRRLALMDELTQLPTKKHTDPEIYPLDRMEVIQEFIRQENEENQEILQMRAEGFSHEDITSKLGLSKSIVSRRRWFSIRNRMCKRLDSLDSEFVE